MEGGLSPRKSQLPQLWARTPGGGRWWEKWANQGGTGSCRGAQAPWGTRQLWKFQGWEEPSHLRRNSPIVFAQLRGLLEARLSTTVSSPPLSRFENSLSEKGRFPVHSILVSPPGGVREQLEFKLQEEINALAQGCTEFSFILFVFLVKKSYSHRLSSHSVPPTGFSADNAQFFPGGAQKLATSSDFIST